MGLSDVLEGGGEFIPMLGSSENAKLKEDTIPEELAILPLRNTVLFPGVLLPITVGREKSVKLIKEVDAGNKFLGVFAQKDGKIEDPTTDDVYKVGVMAHIIKVLKMPDDSTTVIIQGKNRIQIDEWTQTEPFFKAKVKELNTIEVTKTTEDISALVDTVKDMSLKIIELNQNIPTEAGFAVKNIDNPSFLINFISSNLSSDLSQKQALLEIDNFLDRANKVVELLNKDIQLQELKNQIQNKTKSDIDKQQRDYFLNQQMRAIQDELGGSPHEQEINDLKKKAKNKKARKT
jgi:ATP-dependent Lon protease